MNNPAEINFGTTHIEILKEGSSQGVASGFFFNYKAKQKYLVTNRHVVIDEEDNFYPNQLRIILHTNRENLKSNYAIDINLYSHKNEPHWKEHPKYSEYLCDIVLVPLTKQTLSKVNFIKFMKSSIIFFNETHVVLKKPVNSFGDVVVIGYPLGFFDCVNNLPVYRKAMIASDFNINFMDKPYFLIDANLHEGTSGSPVVNSHHTLFKEGKKNEGYVLFGVHSAEHLMEGEPLGLNVVWHANLLEEIAKS